MAKKGRKNKKGANTSLAKKGGRTKKMMGGILEGFNIRHNPIGKLAHKLIQQQSGAGRGSLHRIAFRRDENGKLLGKDPRHI